MAASQGPRPDLIPFDFRLHWFRGRSVTGQGGFLVFGLIQLAAPFLHADWRNRLDRVSLTCMGHALRLTAQGLDAHVTNLSAGEGVHLFTRISHQQDHKQAQVQNQQGHRDEQRQKVKDTVRPVLLLCLAEDEGLGTGVADKAVALAVAEQDGQAGEKGQADAGEAQHPPRQLFVIQKVKATRRRDHEAGGGNQLQEGEGEADGGGAGAEEEAGEGRHPLDEAVQGGRGGQAQRLNDEMVEGPDLKGKGHCWEGVFTLH